LQPGESAGARICQLKFGCPDCVRLGADRHIVVRLCKCGGNQFAARGCQLLN
jgi:hypothetical protein